MHTTRTTHKKRNNEIVKVTMRCNRQGKEKAPKSLEQEEAEIDKDIVSHPKISNFVLCIENTK